MKKYIVFIGILATTACAGLQLPPIDIPTPDPTPPPVVEPDYDEACQALLDGGARFCNEVQQTCSTDESPCVHNPSQDPKHCELAKKCPEAPPEPPTDGGGGTTACPYPLPDSEREMVAKNYGQGLDSTVKHCPGNEWCKKFTGKNQRCCPPAPEGAPYATACNSILLKQACPRWEFKVKGGDTWKPCLTPDHPEMSCDHFDHDDPKTPEYEGNNPVCLKDGNPVETGYFVIGHGEGEVRSCTADGVCSKGVKVNH